MLTGSCLSIISGEIDAFHINSDRDDFHLTESQHCSIVIKIDENTNGIIIIVKFYYGQDFDSNSTKYQEIPE